MKILICFFVIIHCFFAATLKGVILDKLTNKIIEANVTLKNINGKIVSKTATSKLLGGLYKLTDVPKDFNGIIHIEKDGYFDFEQKILIPDTKKYDEFSRDFVITPKKIGAVLELKVSPFDVGKSKLRGGFEIYLDDILQILKLNPTSKIEIIAYPDKANDPKNLEITKNRTEALVQFFYNLGIARERLVQKPNKILDPDNPIPKIKNAKGKRYKGKIYFKIISL